MAEGKKRLAVLVGCNYANTRHELHGCINDVVAMRTALVTRFIFSPGDVELLTDAPGSAVIPTGANIRQALGRMVNRAAPGDVLFFHYSGHGTLIPPVPPHHRWSGHDEAIVPCDLNLITDVDFRQLVDRLPAGVSLTIISDSCHSGGLIDKEKEQIGPSSSFDVADPKRPLRRRKLIPFESLLQHLTSLSGIDSPHVGDHLLQLFGPEASALFSKISTLQKLPTKPDDGILLSGCLANETSADMNPENGSGEAYGAFSDAIQTVLSERPDAISNRELVTEARRVLRERGFVQHPCLYCSDANADAAFLQPLEMKVYSAL